MRNYAYGTVAIGTALEAAGVIFLEGNAEDPDVRIEKGARHRKKNLRNEAGNFVTTGRNKMKISKEVTAAKLESIDIGKFCAFRPRPGEIFYGITCQPRSAKSPPGFFAICGSTSVNNKPICSIYELKDNLVVELNDFEIRPDINSMKNISYGQAYVGLLLFGVSEYFVTGRDESGSEMLIDIKSGEIVINPTEGRYVSFSKWGVYRSDKTENPICFVSAAPEES